MGKKRDRANKNIEKLVDEYVDTVENLNRTYCVNYLNFPGKYPKTECIHDCETCKEDFYLSQKERLRDMYIVE